MKLNLKRLEMVYLVLRIVAKQDPFINVPINPSIDSEMPV